MTFFTNHRFLPWGGRAVRRRAEGRRAGRTPFSRHASPRNAERSHGVQNPAPRHASSRHGHVGRLRVRLNGSGFSVQGRVMKVKDGK